MLILCFGVFVILGLLPGTMSYGMPSSRKPKYPVPRRLRIALVVYGVLVILLGLSHLLPRL